MDSYNRLTWILNLTDGIVWTSAVTALVIPRFAKLPRIRPQVKATYFGACSRNWLLLEMRVRKRNPLSCRTYTPWWLVRRLSISFR